MPSLIAKAYASKEIGGGHVYRCLTLINSLTHLGWQASFLCDEETLRTVPIIQDSNIQLINTIDIEDDFQKIHDQKFTLALIDAYSLNEKYEKRFRDFSDFIFVIDDLADREHECDFLLDQNIGHLEASYKGLVPKGCHNLLGPQYALLKKEFKNNRVKSLSRRNKLDYESLKILISMGLTNIHNATYLILDTLRDWKQKKLEIDVVLGDNAYNLEQIKEICQEINESTDHRVILHLNAKNMAELMSEADFSFGTGGTTSWERCCLGLPCIMIEIAENQSLNAKLLHEKGAVYNLGAIQNVNQDKVQQALERFVNEKGLLKRQSEIASKICDGEGVDRVCNMIKQRTNV
jgi:UDP-2,4-diacetamido-2,4,6-trideoxy-beta-L-altropyranose hydrolase